MSDIDSRSGMAYYSAEILSFADRIHHGHDEALEAAFQAPDRHGMPSIQVARADGALLGLLIRMHGAKRIVEVGTLAGYSAVLMARAAGPESEVWTIEYDAKHAEVARESIARAGLSERIHVLVGTGLEMLEELAERGPFDAVFLDADKGNYDRYGQWAESHLKPGGLLLADNSYLFGRLLEASDEAAAMRRFHEQTAKNFDSVCIPTPDGLVAAIRR